MTDKRQLILDALEYCGGTHTLDDVLRAIKKGSMQVFESEHAIIVTEIVEYPRLRACHLFLVAGDMVELLEQLQPKVVEFAKEQGCVRLTCAGRFGWTRVLPASGWRPDCAVLSRILSE